MAQSSYVPTENSRVWDVITERLSKFEPAIVLEQFIDFGAKKPVVVKGYTSEGIDFAVHARDRERLLGAIRAAQTSTGKRAFDLGEWKGALHTLKGAALDLSSAVTGNTSDESWALDASFKATKGTGAREIWYLELPDRELRFRNPRAYKLETPELDTRFSAKFAAPNEAMDLSSLHFAVERPNEKTGRCACNIHIDQVGVNANLGSGSALTPDVPYHTFVELAFRTGLKGILPDPVLQNVDFIMPSSHENFALNFGVQVNFIKRDDLKLNVRGMCGVRDGGCDWSATVNLSGRFDWLGGK